MQDGLTRAQHYRALAAQMRDVARLEPEVRRRNELTDLARQYDRLAEKLISVLGTPVRGTDA
jgi:hypothetical protein